MFSKFKNAMRMNKKGILLDGISLLVGILGVVITLVVAIVVFNSFRTSFNDSGLSTTEVNESMVKFEGAFTTFDHLFFPLAIIGLIIGMIVTSFFIPSHPVFAVINIIGLVFLIFLSTIFRYVWQEFSAVSELSSAAGGLTVTNVMMTYLPWVGVVAVAIATIVGYAKYQQGGQY